MAALLAARPASVAGEDSSRHCVGPAAAGPIAGLGGATVTVTVTVIGADGTRTPADAEPASLGGRKCRASHAALGGGAGIHF